MIPPPRLVAWEVTRRCPLRCRHCRGAARDVDYAGELTTAEGRLLLEHLAAMGPMILILTGGEPMARPDIYDLARYGTDLGLRVVMSPCGPSLNAETAARIREAGIQRLSISLDGATAAVHDDFRGTPGAFAATLNGIAAVREAGIAFQVNTTVARHNVDELQQLYELAIALGAVCFNPFFLVPTGRGAAIADLELSPAAYEETLLWLHERAEDGRIEVRPTCAPHWYRIRRQQGAQVGRTRGCLGGQGFVFVSHVGILQPCGFLPLPCGDLRAANFDFAGLYERSEVFRKLRDRSGYHGKCGVCEYLGICGGCRARAWAANGDYLGPETYCRHQPRARETADG